MDEQGDRHKELTGLEAYFTRDELRALLAVVENTKSNNSEFQQTLSALSEKITQAINNDAS